MTPSLPRGPGHRTKCRCGCGKTVSYATELRHIKKKIDAEKRQ